MLTTSNRLYFEILQRRDKNHEHCFGGWLSSAPFSGIGKPKGTWEEKQKSYFEMVKSGKIKNPVAKTLDYYHIMKDERGEYIINLLPK